MPRWLSAWIATTLFCVWAILLLIGVPFLITQLTSKGEPGFQQDQKAWLLENHPQGVYVSDHTYRWCENGQFQYTAPDTRAWSMHETCTQMPVLRK